MMSGECHSPITLVGPYLGMLDRGILDIASDVLYRLPDMLCLRNVRILLTHR